MGEIYLAEDTALRRNVALKFLFPEAASDPETKNRFCDEAQAAASLNHPNIVTIYEVNEYEGRPYFAMEYIEGESLDTLVSDEGLPPQRAADIAVRICRGLNEAHKLGMIHRDLKPSNIMIDNEGQVKILDFGLAVSPRMRESEATVSTGGTLAYMSPEQVQDGPMTTASDMFSLGVIMYEMITGKRPFEADYEASLSYAIVNEEPKAVEELKPETPLEIIDLISRMLKKNPEERFQKAGDAIEALDRVATPETRFWIGRTIGRSSRKFVFVSVIIIIVAAALYGLRDQILPRTLEKKTLAVLPFENLGDSGDEYFTDGMTDAVTMHLARFGELAVISRTSSMQYKGSDKNMKQIGFELGAEYILTGTVQWDKRADAERVKIGASLVRVEDDTYLWSESYERVIDKVFALQSEIASNVTDALNVAVSRDEILRMERQPTQNLEAYDFYLRGNEYFNRSWDKEDIEIAVGLYRRSVELDPDFALAHAMLSRAHGMMYSEFYDRSEKRLHDARQAVERSLELDPGLVEGHLALGYCYYCRGEYDMALEQFAVVRKLQPNNRYLYNAIGAVQRRQGDFDKAVQNFIRALRLDPLSFLRAFDVAVTYGLMRRYSDAEKYLDRAIILAPDWPLPYVYRSWLYILRDGDRLKAHKVMTDASAWIDFSNSKYYWWLARIVEDDYDAVIAATSPGSDTAAYFLHLAQMNRLLGRESEEYAYSDSARVILIQKMSARQEEARYHSYLGKAYAGLRMKEQAIYHSRKGVELMQTSRDAFDVIYLMVDLAEILVIFGEHDAAIDQLEQLLARPGFISPSCLRLDPLWIPLHDMPRFKNLIGEKSEKQGT